MLHPCVFLVQLFDFTLILVSHHEPSYLADFTCSIVLATSRFVLSLFSGTIFFSLYSVCLLLMSHPQQSQIFFAHSHFISCLCSAFLCGLSSPLVSGITIIQFYSASRMAPDCPKCVLLINNFYKDYLVRSCSCRWLRF